MKSGVHKHLGLAMLLIWCCLLWQPAVYGQKKGKRKSKELTEEEIYQADFYFIEAEKFYLIEDYAKALSMFSRSLEINDKNAAAHYKIAQIYIEEQKFLEALPHAIKSKELDPENKYYYILNAKLALQLGDFNGAATNYEQLLEKFAENDEYLFDLAEIYGHLEEREKAIAVYDRLEYIHGKYIQITRQKEKLYLELKDEKSAENEWKELIEFSPNGENYRGYLSFLEKAGKQGQLKEVMQQAITDNPEDQVLELRYAGLTLKGGDVAGAIKILEKPIADRSLAVLQKLEIMSALVLTVGQREEDKEALLALGRSLSETHPESFEALAFTGDIYYKFQETDQALGFYLKAVEKNSVGFEIWRNIIIIQSQNENYAEVVAYADKAKEVFPNQALLYLYAGTAYLAQKQYTQAVNELRRGSRYARRNVQMLQSFYNQLGDAYHQMGDHEKSDESFDKVLELNENNDYALNNYSFYLSLRGEKLSQAQQMSTRLVTAFPENPSYLDTHAWVLYKNGEFKDARKVLEKALRINDGNGTIIEHYGDVLFKLGRKEEAVVQWQKAKEVGQTSDLIDKKIADRKLYE